MSTEKDERSRTQSKYIFICFFESLSKARERERRKMEGWTANREISSFRIVFRLLRRRKEWIRKSCLNCPPANPPPPPRTQSPQDNKIWKGKLFRVFHLSWEKGGVCKIPAACLFCKVKVPKWVYFLVFSYDIYLYTLGFFLFLWFFWVETSPFHMSLPLPCIISVLFPLSSF